MTPATAESDKILQRSDLDEKDTWNLELIYPDLDQWEIDLKKLDDLAKPIIAMQGKLDSAEKVAEIFKLSDELGRTLEKLYSYAHHRADENTGDNTNQGRQARVMAKYAEISAQTAWINPEILSHDLETLKNWRNADVLKEYTYSMDCLIREKPHVLSDKEERILSMASEVFRVPSNTFNFLTNADMKFPDTKDESGKDKKLTNSTFVKFLESKDREVRKGAFENIYDTYIGHKNTLASTLSGKIKLDNFNAKVRNYPNAITAALQPDNIPVKLYEQLIESVHEALPIFYEYVDLRKELLGLDKLDMYDQYVPIVPDFKVDIDWDQAKEYVLKACEPMGEDYLKGVEECFNNRWIDVYETEGKRSGAYSGGCYDSPAYILMNYQGNLNWVFTLAHELGHSMHSWLAKQKQPYRDSQYTIFVAEIASTTNEALLHDYLLKTNDDPRFQAYLLNHLCDSFKGTVFRQTMFAEFEKIMHEMDAEGKPLTSDSLSEVYYELNKKYYGSGVEADKRIANEWSRIPHFYYNFYVYKYATGFCASQVFSKRILESADQRNQYLDFLSAGGSADSLDLVKKGGVDLLNPQVMKDAFATFKESVTKLRELLT